MTDKTMLISQNENLPATFDFPDCNSGLEEITGNDTAVLLIKVAQPSSKVTQKGNPLYIKGLEPGFLFINTTKEFFSGEDGIRLVCAKMKKTVQVWEPERDSTGKEKEGGTSKLRGIFDRKDQLFSSLVDSKESEILLDSSYGDFAGFKAYPAYDYYCLILGEFGNLRRVIVSMSKSQRRTARVWNSAMTEFRIPVKGKLGEFKTAPSFARFYRLKTEYVTVDNNSWYVFNISAEDVLNTSDPAQLEIAKQALEYRKLIDQGSVHVNTKEFEEELENVPFDTSAKQEKLY